MSAVYRGIYDGRKAIVMVDGETLNPRSDVRKFSTSFDWGSDSRESLQLAVAILAHAMGTSYAVGLWNSFHQKVIRELLPQVDWSMSQQDVRDAVAEIEAASLMHGVLWDE